MKHDLNVLLSRPPGRLLRRVAELILGEAKSQSVIEPIIAGQSEEFERARDRGDITLAICAKARCAILVIWQMGWELKAPIVLIAFWHVWSWLTKLLTEGV
jgi:hypothetical protein